MLPNALPVLYLNPLEHQGKTFIKFWHKPHPLLTQKLKTAAWVKYSQTYKCYVMPHSPQAVAQTYSFFTGLAAVNTRYLYRSKRLRPAEGATVGAGPHASAPLTKLAELTVVRLIPLVYQQQNLIEKITRIINKFTPG